MSKMAQLIGFQPDVDPTTPGVLLDCSNIIPFDAGFLAAPSPVAVQAAALAGECRGATVATKLDGTRRIFAGTQTKLYELTGSVWTDRSAGGGSYTGSVESRWIFAQFGDTTIASNLVDAMQASTTGAFAAISGAPKAKIVVSAANNFVIAFNTNDGTYGVSTDRWWCSAQNDQTNWTPSVSTGATTGRLIATEGPITAALTLGDYVIAYKARGIYVGAFVGANSGSWQWTLVPGSTECGAVGPEAVCSIGSAHFIVGEDDFWLFDGTRPIPLGDGIRDWFRRNSSQTYRYRTKVVYDRQRNTVWVNYASADSNTGACDRTLAFHVGTKRWGRMDRVVQAALNFSSPGVTIDGLDAYSSTIDGLPAIPFDSQYWLAGGRLYAYFDSSNQLVSNTGTAGASSITTADMGDDEGVSTMIDFRIRFTRSPASALATGLWAMNEGDGLVVGPACALNEGKFDLLQSGRFHRVRVDLTGDHRMTGYRPQLALSGGR